MKMYYVFRHGFEEGPYTFEQMSGMNISPADLVWHPGLSAWKKAAELEELHSLKGFTPPPVPHNTGILSSSWKLKLAVVCCFALLVAALIMFFLANRAAEKADEIARHTDSVRKESKTIERVLDLRDVDMVLREHEEKKAVIREIYEYLKIADVGGRRNLIADYKSGWVEIENNSAYKIDRVEVRLELKSGWGTTKETQIITVENLVPHSRKKAEVSFEKRGAKLSASIAGYKSEELGIK
jgi:hypothetical protein